jgi:glycosyltransferase involved in cell wall biosynthesis
MAMNFYGGAETQIMKTMKGINDITEDYSVTLFNPWVNKIIDFDIVHLFKPDSFLQESLSIIQFAQRKGKKIVVSPIFFKQGNITYDQNNQIIDVLDKWALNYRKLLRTRGMRYFDPYSRLEVIFHNASMLLPNTHQEGNQIRRIFNVPQCKMRIVPNGVDSRFKTGNENLFKSMTNLWDFILFTGRIEPRKNVLRLIQAFRMTKLDTKLVIIGQKTEDEYFKACQMAANENVIFMEPILHDSELLRSAYKAAKVVVLPSYFETPGLSALEGGLAGANIVVTKYGGPKEYFGDLAWYIDPLSAESISKALIDAYHLPFRRRLKNNSCGRKLLKRQSKLMIIHKNHLKATGCIT